MREEEEIFKFGEKIAVVRKNESGEGYRFMEGEYIMSNDAVLIFSMGETRYVVPWSSIYSTYAKR